MVHTALRVLTGFAEIFLELLALFIAFSFAVHFLQAYVPFEKLERWMVKRGGLAGNAAGALLGFVTPFCSCSTIPLLVTMLDKRVPFQAAMSFLFASPLLDPWVLALMAWICGGKTTAVYAAVTFLFSMVIGYVLDRLGFARHVKNVRVKGNMPEPNSAARRGDWLLNLRESWEETWSLLRTTGAYLAVGAFIGALIREAVPTGLLQLAGDQNPWWTVPLFALIGIPLYIRLSTMLPVAQALMLKGIPAAPVMALLIGGAGASLPEIVMLGSIFRKPLVIAFVVSVFLMATFAGYLFLILNL